MILPDTDADGARNRAETIRRSIAEDLNFQWDGEAITVSVSVGVATVAQGGRVTPDDMIGAADRALYEAKHTGRNRVVFRECTGDSASEPWPLKAE